MKGRISISAGAVLLLTVLYYIGGLTSLAALLSAALAHEAGHMAALALCRVPVLGFEFTASGMSMRVGDFPDIRKQFVCLISGPAAGFAFSFAASAFGNFTGSSFFLESAGFSVILSCFNLLPAEPLDGGRLLSCMLYALLEPEPAEILLDVLGLLTAASLTAAGLMLLRKEYGIAVFFSGIYLLIFESGLVKCPELL